MKQTGICPKCGSADIVADVKVIDRGDANYQGEMTVATFRDPGALIFKGKQETKVSAWVCGSCGYMEFYADDPAAIKLPEA
jgi:ribosomal protein S27AE